MMSSYILYPGVDAPTPNIYSRVPVTWLNVATGTTNECPLIERHVLNRAADRTGLGAWQIPINLDHFFAGPLPGHTIEDGHELGKAQVTDLAAPQPLHAVDVQVFKAQHVVLSQQPTGQFEVAIAALVGQSDMSESQTTFSFTPIGGAFDLARQGPVQTANLGHILAEELRRLVLPALVVGQERFQPEVETADLIRAGFDRLNILNDREAKVQSPGPVALDCDRLDLAFHRAAEGELIVQLADLNPVAAVVFPTGLLEREASVFLHLLEPGPTGLARSLAGLVLEEPPIGRIVSLDYVLYRLTAEQLPLRAATVPQLGDVLHHAELVDISAKHAVVAPLQGRGMVPDDPGHVYLLNKRPVSPVVVEAVFQGLADLHSLPILLIFDVLPHSILRDMPHALAVVAPCPKRWNTTSQARKHLAEPSGRYPLQLLDNIVRRKCRRGLDEQVDVIRHDFHTGDSHSDALGLLNKQTAQLDLDLAGQNLAAIFWTPYQVIADVVDRLVACYPSGTAHTFYYTVSRLILQAKDAIHPTSELVGFLTGRS